MHDVPNKTMRNNLMLWSPVDALDHFIDDRMGHSLNSNISPAVDIYQDKDHVIVEVQIPSIDPKDVEINVENDVLTISGETEKKEEVERENYYRKEIRSGSFVRRVILPMAVKGQQAKAEYTKGLLTVTLPKTEEVKPKKIPVKITESKRSNRK